MRNNSAMAGLGIAVIAVAAAVTLLMLGGRQSGPDSDLGLGAGESQRLVLDEPPGTQNPYSVPGAFDLDPGLAEKPASPDGGATADALDIATGALSPDRATRETTETKEKSATEAAGTKTAEVPEPIERADAQPPPADKDLAPPPAEPLSPPETAPDASSELLADATAPEPLSDSGATPADVSPQDTAPPTGDARLDGPLLAKPTDYPLVAVYFDGNSNSGLRLAVSFDGLRWREVTRNYGIDFNPRVGRYGVFRDPSFDRGPDGVFHLVWTAGKDGFSYARSTDLIHWDDVRYIKVDGPMFEGKNRIDTWAPEVYYDHRRGGFVITFATSTRKVPTLPNKFKGNMKSYYVTTKDFKTFSDANMLLTPHPDVFEIDSALFQGATDYIVYLKVEALNQVDGKKDGIYYAFADRLEGPWSSLRKLDIPSMRRNSEGPSPVQVGGRYIVYFDKIPGMQAARSSDFKHWEDITNQLVPPPNFRHGTIRNLGMRR